MSTTNKMSDSDFFKIQDKIRLHQVEYNSYVKNIKPENKISHLSLWARIKNWFKKK